MQIIEFGKGDIGFSLSGELNTDEKWLALSFVRLSKPFEIGEENEDIKNYHEDTLYTIYFDNKNEVEVFKSKINNNSRIDIRNPENEWDCSLLFEDCEKSVLVVHQALNILMEYFDGKRSPEDFEI